MRDNVMTYGYHLRPRLPRLLVYRIGADPSSYSLFGWNRYRGPLGTATIGAVLNWRGRSYSFVWGRPKFFGSWPRDEQGALVADAEVAP